MSDQQPHQQSNELLDNMIDDISNNNDTGDYIDTTQVQQTITLEHDDNIAAEYETEEMIDNLDDTKLDNNDDVNHNDNNINNVTLIDDSVNGFFKHNDSIYAIDTYNDYVVTGDGFEDQCCIYVWNITTGDIVQQLESHTDSVTCIKFSSDGKLLAIGSMSSQLDVYDVDYDNNRFTLKHRLQGPSSDIEFISWHPLGNVFACGTSDTTVWLYNGLTGDMMRVFTGHNSSVLCGCWTYDGKLLVTGSEDGSVIVWSPKTGDAVFKLQNIHNNAVTCITSYHNQNMILTGSTDNTGKLINIDTQKVLSTFSNNDGIEGVGFCNTLKLCATGSVDGFVRIFDLNTNTMRVEYKYKPVPVHHQQQQDTNNNNNTDTANDDATMIDNEVSITQLTWHKTEPYIYTSNMDGIIRCTDGRTAKVINIWQGHQQAVLGFTVNYKHNRLISISDDSTALVFDLNSNRVNG